MRTTIDPAGRIVIPKSLRDRLGLRGGQSLEILETERGLEMAPLPTPMSLRHRRGGPVAVATRKLPPLDDELVRATLERTRR